MPHRWHRLQGERGTGFVAAGGQTPLVDNSASWKTVRELDWRRRYIGLDRGQQSFTRFTRKIRGSSLRKRFLSPPGKDAVFPPGLRKSSSLPKRSSMQTHGAKRVSTSQFSIICGAVESAILVHTVNQFVVSGGGCSEVRFGLRLALKSHCLSYCGSWRRSTIARFLTLKIA